MGGRYRIGELLERVGEHRRFSAVTVQDHLIVSGATQFRTTRRVASEDSPYTAIGVPSGISRDPVRQPAPRATMKL
ncbi:Hypothetical protein CGLY_16670 (plasmid) [Corynebacterium glyciniphilum AJ 3170]|uniref:Uncharacterized protein n=1 Tax=Corynebacterium glyciniphilum AJ 3170 TaxID=1404245 RepID=X5DYN3_9CORY|nr:Hypothetical protein CGLY_16670 [Corynebacterium glyciniphilum AJ 3170]